MRSSPLQIDALAQLQEYQSRMIAELEQARHMHLMLLPTTAELVALEQHHQIAVSYFLEPCEQLGGDIWDIFSVDTHQFGFYICDFTGHGVSAAINTFRLHSAMEHLKEWYAQPAQLLTRLNHYLGNWLSTETFATFFYGVIDTQQNQLCYATAGAPSPFHYSATNQTCLPINCDNFPLGIVKDYHYPQQEMPFHSGDSLCLYSDALLESLNYAGSNTITDAFLIEQIKQLPEKPAKTGQRSAIRKIIQKIGLLDGQSCDDDLTVAFISRL